ncbi:HAD-IC family P-type ATPase [Actinocorallia sp. A-T 12471]|uniref:HAD-IC family P-type ATPase n=1 Tax=Actinocorallia sp. A-T 12471 TaxID=3089813 RepID=UPI0029CEE5AB|nr:HAD-IC family P-type ATPase [Actinocorallia sp. A-T 12471]MDX6738419.1 HAD-IC family P-type ATPase [Actinocorallia sp. A-T 12471]
MTLAERAATGLTAAEVAERVAAGLVNRVPRRSSRSVAEIVRANVLTRFNALIGALFVLVMVFGDWRDGLFGGIILANTLIGIVQELRAKRTLDRLAVLGEQRVRVVRDGRPVEVAQAAVVKDDLVMVAAGDRIVVDGPVVESRSLEVDESLLTGEAEPVAKRPGDEMLSGSFVVAGSGSFTAGKVGRDAYAARLVEEASRFKLAESELQTGINKFLKYVTWLLVPVGVLLTISQFLSTRSFSDAVVGAVAGVVTMVPEGLVLMTSIAFAVGVVRLGRRRCLVQELPAIEGLARVDVLCLDKTGTLTEPGMDLEKVVPTREGLPVDRALRSLVAADPSPNPTMRAIAASLGEGDGPVWPPGEVVPFSSARKWSGTSFGEHGDWMLGAPDVLLAAGSAELKEAERIGATGRRVLAVAHAPEGGLAALVGGGGAAVEAAALVVLWQRLRPEAKETLAYFAHEGVAVKVLSGDDPVSVGAIAAALGVPGADRPYDARKITDADIEEVLETHTVFGRVSPQQKRAMVRALQARGHTVAMTGDGVNDVLALKDADLGVAMGSGSGATRAVAKVVLLDDSFATLPHVVAEGRRVLGNIERVANLFLTKTVYSILLSVLVGIVGVRFPFLPRHLTLISALTIGVPAFVLALAPNLERARPGFVPRVLRFAVPAGLACGAATFAGYVLASDDPRTEFAQDSTTATFALFVLSLWVLALIARPYTWWRVALVASMGAAFLVVIAVPGLREFFALQHQSAENDAVALAIAVAAALLLSHALRHDWYDRTLNLLLRRH